jgi:hypothetical protein
MWRRGGSFQRLPGPATPNAQHLWFYLLTGDATSAVPGVTVVDRVVLAAKLGWTDHMPAFDACVLAIETQQMAAFDWDAGMVWCRAALKYNPPQSPNVLKSWGKAFDLLPECQLKDDVLEAVADLVDDLVAAAERRKPGAGKAFAEAFLEAFPKDPVSVSVSVSDTASAPKKPRRKPPKVEPGQYDKSPGFAEVWAAYPNGSGKKVAHKAWIKAVAESRIIDGTWSQPGDPGPEAITPEALLKLIEERARFDRQWLKDDGEFVPMLSTFLNQSRWTDGWKRPKRKVDQHVGSHEFAQAQYERDQQPTAEDKERKVAVKGILTYCTKLLELDLPAKLTPIAKRHAKEMRELTENADLKPSGMLGDFYDAHDEFIDAAFGALSQKQKAEVEAGRHPKTDKAAWRRKRMCELYDLPVALDVDPEDT